MLLAEVDDARWLVHVSRDVPDVEVFSRVPLLYTVLHFIWTIGSLHALLQTVMGEV